MNRIKGERTNTITQSGTYQKKMCSFTSHASPSPDPSRSLGSRWSSCDSRERAFWRLQEWNWVENELIRMEENVMEKMEYLENDDGWCEWEGVHVQASRQQRQGRLRKREQRYLKSIQTKEGTGVYLCHEGWKGQLCSHYLLEHQLSVATIRW